MSAYGWQGDEDTRICSGCGQKIILKGSSIWFERFPVVRSWHFRCRLSLAARS